MNHGVTQAQTPNCINSGGHLVLPKAAKFMQPAELNVDAFIFLSCSSLGNQPGKQLCGLIRAFLPCQSPWYQLQIRPSDGVWPLYWVSSTVCTTHTHRHNTPPHLAMSLAEGGAFPQETDRGSPPIPLK